MFCIYSVLFILCIACEKVGFPVVEVSPLLMFGSNCTSLVLLSDVFDTFTQSSIVHQEFNLRFCFFMVLIVLKTCDDIHLYTVVVVVMTVRSLLATTICRVAPLWQKPFK